MSDFQAASEDSSGEITNPPPDGLELDIKCLADAFVAAGCLSLLKLAEAPSRSKDKIHNPSRRRLWKTLISSFLLWRNYKGGGFFIGVFESRTDPVRTAKGLHAEQACHDFIPRLYRGGGIAAMADEDGIVEGGEDFLFGRCVVTGVCQRTGIVKLFLSVTNFQEVD